MEEEEARQVDVLMNETSELHFFRVLNLKYPNSIYQRLCCENLHLITCSPGETIFQAGSDSDTFYVVIDGYVQVICEVDKRSFRIEKTISKGGHFGEFGMIQRKPRSMSIRNGNYPTQLGVLSAESFHRIFDSFTIQIDLFFSPYLALCRNARFLDHWSDAQVHSLIANAFLVHFKEDQPILIKNGKQAQGTLVLLEGSIGIEINSNAYSVLQPGEIINEEFMLDSNSPAAYSSTCVSQFAKVLFISNDVLHKFIIQDQIAYAGMLMAINAKQMRLISIASQKNLQCQEISEVDEEYSEELAARPFKLRLYPCAEQTAFEKKPSIDIDVSFSEDIFSTPKKTPKPDIDSPVVINSAAADFIDPARTDLSSQVEVAIPVIRTQKRIEIKKLDASIGETETAKPQSATKKTITTTAAPVDQLSQDRVSDKSFSFCGQSSSQQTIANSQTTIDGERKTRPRIQQKAEIVPIPRDSCESKSQTNIQTKQLEQPEIKIPSVKSTVATAGPESNSSSITNNNNSNPTNSYLYRRFRKTNANYLSSGNASLDSTPRHPASLIVSDSTPTSSSTTNIPATATTSTAAQQKEQQSFDKINSSIHNQKKELKQSRDVSEESKPHSKQTGTSDYNNNQMNRTVHSSLNMTSSSSSTKFNNTCRQFTQPDLLSSKQQQQPMQLVQQSQQQQRCFELFRSNSPPQLNKFVERSVSVNILKQKYIEKQQAVQKQGQEQPSQSLSTKQLQFKKQTAAFSIESSKSQSHSPRPFIGSRKTSMQIVNSAAQIRPTISSCESLSNLTFRSTGPTTESQTETQPMPSQQQLQQQQQPQQLQSPLSILQSKPRVSSKSNGNIRELLQKNQGNIVAPNAAVEMNSNNDQQIISSQQCTAPNSGGVSPITGNGNRYSAQINKKELIDYLFGGAARRQGQTAVGKKSDSSVSTSTAVPSQNKGFESFQSAAKAAMMTTTVTTTTTTTTTLMTTSMTTSAKNPSAILSNNVNNSTDQKRLEQQKSKSTKRQNSPQDFLGSARPSSNSNSSNVLYPLTLPKSLIAPAGVSTTSQLFARRLTCPDERLKTEVAVAALTAAAAIGTGVAPSSIEASLAESISAKKSQRELLSRISSIKTLPSASAGVVEPPQIKQKENLSPIIRSLHKKRHSSTDLKFTQSHSVDGSYQSKDSSQQQQQEFKLLASSTMTAIGNKSKVHTLKSYDQMISNIASDRSPNISPLLEQLHGSRKLFGITNMKRFIHAHVKQFSLKKKDGTQSQRDLMAV